MNVKEILPYFDAITWGLRWQSGKVFQTRCATSSLTIHIRGFLREKPHPDSCRGISWMSLGQESPCPFPPQPAALLAVRSPQRHRTGIYVRTWTSIQAQRDPTSMPPGHPGILTTDSASHTAASPCPNAKPLCKCWGAGHFPWLPPVSLLTPLATTEGQSSENKATLAQESQDPTSRPALPQGAVWPWTSHWASLGHKFPMGIWTRSVREFGLGQWGNVDWASEGIWIGQCFSNNYCLQLGPDGRAGGQRQKCESPAPSAVRWFLFHQNRGTMDSLAKSSLNPTSHPQPSTLSSKAFPSCDTMSGIYPPGHRRYNQSRESH